LSNFERPGHALDNKLLASLPRGLFDELVPHLTTAIFPQGLVLREPGDEISDIYFPHNGMISLLTVMRDGKAIEVATVGREGVVGAMAGFDLYRSLVRIVVQLPMAVSKMTSPHFRKVLASSDAIQKMSLQYNEVLLSQARVTAACNALHPIEGRFCRWLLQTADRDSDDDEISLTQGFLAEMLGVRRTSVTDVAQKIQQSGAITYSRGVIKILDRPALERLSCECYEALLDQSQLLSKS
jgi:CRP-like cAMP-binding protein